MELFAFGFPILFYIVPILMCAIILVGLIRTIKEWNHNEHSPRLTVPVTVVTVGVVVVPELDWASIST